MCKCIVGILLADAITISLLYTAFIELNLKDARYDITKIFREGYDDPSKEDARIIMASFLLALVVHTLSTFINWIYELLCLFRCCCAGPEIDTTLYA